ncbi:hypothetical protein ABW19_dt0201138 [Dactylella cylindrospora]|nr:hypothetical protein ABW19_dt0201138 [Dactylella cylindrospora]
MTPATPKDAKGSKTSKFFGKLKTLGSRSKSLGSSPQPSTASLASSSASGGVTQTGPVAATASVPPSPTQRPNLLAGNPPALAIGPANAHIPVVRVSSPPSPTAVVSVGGFAAPIKSLWAEAADKLSQEEREQLDKYNSDKLVDEVLQDTETAKETAKQKAWKIKWGDNSIIVRDLAEKALAWIKKFKEVGDVAVQYDPGHASLPWAGVRFLLQMAISDFENQAAVLVGIEKITFKIGRYTAYEKLYLGLGLEHEGNLRERMITCYCCVLRFLIKAKTFFETSNLDRIGASLLPTSFHSELLAALEDAEKELMLNIDVMASQRSEQTSESISQGLGSLEKILQELDKPISRIDKATEAIVDHLNGNQRGKILKWISSINHNLQHEFVQETITSGTCTWLHVEEKFLEWRKSSSSGLFWLKGDPGCGKTRLTSSVIQLLLANRDKNQSQESIAYFYCDAKTEDKSRTDTANVLRSLLKQIAALRPGQPIQQPIKAAYDARVSSGNSGSPPSFSEAKSLVLGIADDQLYPEITIIIDAMDECDKKKRGDLLDFLVKLIQEANSLVKVFLSSRPHEQDLNLQLEDVLKHYVELDHTTPDIHRFIDMTMADYVSKKKFLPRVDAGEREILKEKVIQHLKAKAAGM